jgi:hypoxanthine phosphoribosyltransferase
MGVFMSKSKYYFSYNQIHQTIARSSRDILDSNFEPNIILAIGSGGFIPARILRTFINKPILTISVSYYSHNNLPTTPREHQWLDGIDIAGKKILVVDEVDDTRVTLEYCLNRLFTHNPAEIAVFVLHNKLKPKQGQYPKGIKHVFIGENLDDRWISYPWDAKDINEHERHTNDQ